MKNHLLFIALFLAYFEGGAQVKSGIYAVQFTDKGCTQFALDDPQEFLTQRAIDRREKFDIALDSTDIPVCQSYIDSISSLTGVSFRFSSKWFNTAIFSFSNLASLDTVQSWGFVKSTDDFIAKTNPVWKYGAWTQQEESFKTNALDYGQAGPQIEMILLDQLHTEGYTGEGMRIAVLDAGFRGVDEHDAFDHLYPTQILHEWDVIEANKQIYLSSIDIHGRQVFSILAAEVPGDYQGSAPDADYVLIRTEDNTSESLLEEWAWISGAEIADSIGCDVVNSSLGYNTFDGNLNNHTYQDMDGQTTVAALGATMAARKGVAVVCAAGNEGQGRILTPADADSILTVGAVDGNGNYASFSSVGPAADGRVKPDVAAWGKGTKYITSSGGITGGNGTSFASPIMAGAVACLMQKFPQANVQEILQAIRESASQYATPDSLLGYGVPDMMQACALLDDMAVDVPELGADMAFISNGHINIRYDDPLTHLRLVNVLGQVLREGTALELQGLSTIGWAPGVYVLSGEQGFAKLVVR